MAASFSKFCHASGY